MKRYVTREYKDVSQVIRDLTGIEPTQENPIEIIVQAYSGKRSLAQNRALYGWYYKNLAKALEDGGIIIEDDEGKEWPYTADILHEMFREFFLVKAVIKRQGKERKLYWSTADLPKSKPGDDGRPSFSEYIDKIKNFARDHWDVYLQDPGDEFY